MTKFYQPHLVAVTADDVVRFCRQKYGIVPNSKVIEQGFQVINLNTEGKDNDKTS